MFMPRTYTYEAVLEELRRKAEEIGQTQLAKDLGISLSMMNDLVHGRRDISERVAEALGYTRQIIFRKSAA